jgi:predicted transglutaminase-like cysteine proteinase
VVRFSASAAFIALILLGLVVSAPPAFAGPPVPAAFQAFCARFASECRSQNAETSPLRLTTERVAELKAVNSLVNRTVREATDAAIYGRADVWALPTRGIGDCEDFALMKRHDLIARGWPSSALLVTVVRDQHGDGHAVLTAVFDQGEYVLDNRTASLLPPSRTGYTFYIRQSAASPSAWEWIGGSGRAVTAVAAASR